MGIRIVMTKQKALVLLLFLVGIGGVLIIVNKTSNYSESEINEGGMMQKQEVMQPTSTTDTNSDMMGSDSMIKQGQYVGYSKDVLNQSATGRRVLFFYANWCPTCRPADTNFNNNGDKIPQDTTLIRVNYNDSDTDVEEKDLAAKYGVTYQHTFVQIDGNGAVVTKWNGGQIEELLANLK